MIAFIQHRSLIIAVVLHPKSIVCLCVVSQKTAVEFVTTCSSLNPRLNLSSTQTFFCIPPPFGMQPQALGVQHMTLFSEAEQHSY